MLKLKDLLKSINVLEINNDRDLNIDGIAYHSQKVMPGYIFVSVRGYKVDGHGYIADAINRGAVAIVVDRDIAVDLDITIIKVENTRRALAQLGAAYYGYPTNKLDLIGITGTNGKTSITHMVRSILLEANQKVGLIGTISNLIGDEEIEAVRTTPESLDLQELFNRMVEKNIDSCVMEASSHSLALDRLEGCSFKVGVFTNLTVDHLDFHGNMENYREAKKLLFFKTSLCNVINADDRHGQIIINDIKTLSTPLITYGVNNKADIYATNINLTLKDVSFDVVTPKYTVSLKINIPGLFSVYNSLAAFSAAYGLGIDKDIIVKGLTSLKGVPGRFETVREVDKFTIIIDYAHTPDALENVLNSVNKFRENNIITVFGCGGDRDKSKRPIMGEISGKLSDITIITSDNPRSEDPKEIIDEVKVGIEKTNSQFFIEEDRRNAITHALKIAKEKDIILIVGKGHEKEQVIGDKVYPFDDKEVAKDIAKELGLINL